MHRLLSASLVAALAGVMAACTGGGAPGSKPSPPPPSPTPQSATIAPPSRPAGAPIRIPVSGAAPDAIEIDGQTAWVLAGEGGKLIEVDLAEAREVRAIDVGFGATHLALIHAGLAAVGRFDNGGGTGYLPVIDLETGKVNSVTTGALGGLSGGDEGVVWALEKAGPR